MKPYDIVFTLNASEKLIVSLDEQLEKLPCYCTIPIIFLADKQKYILSEWGLPDDIIIFKKHLIKALQNKLQLHKSIVQNLGYLENIERKHDYLQAKIENETKQDQWEKCPELTYSQEETYPCWVGSAYKVWGYENLATWIYNDNTNNIIFEITPRYPNLFTNKKNLSENDYKQWMLSYKPVLTRIISRETAESWLEQACNIVMQIDSRWKKEQS